MAHPPSSWFQQWKSRAAPYLSTGHLHFLDDILSTLLPKTCPLCRRKLREPDRGFCSPCSSSFHLIRPPLCVCCGEPMTSPADLCGACICRPPSPGAPRPRVRSAALHIGPLREAILGAKYAGRMAVAHSLGIFLKSQYEIFFAPETFDRILPVPLHVRRLRQRGFNQCELLARPLAKKLSLPLDRDTVVRTRHTSPQSGTGREQRHRNLRGAFSVEDPSRVRGRSFLILDDVYTTGATVDALSEALFSAGAAKVSAFTLTRSL